MEHGRQKVSRATGKRERELNDVQVKFRTTKRHAQMMEEMALHRRVPCAQIAREVFEPKIEEMYRALTGKAA